MDEALRRLERELRAAPRDPSARARWRSAQERLGAADPVGRSASQLEVLGAFAWPGELGLAGPPPWPRWLHLGAGERPPLCLPALPPGPAPRRLWSARGRACWASADLLLLSAPDGALEARCAASGVELWRVPAEVGPADLPPPGLADQEEAERREVLGWVAAPWGAARVGLELEASLERRRVGRRDAERGRVTEPAVLGRGDLIRSRLTLQLVAPAAGTWSAAAPLVALEEALDGEPLCQSELCVEAWEDELLSLGLDPLRPFLALRGGDLGEASRDQVVLGLIREGEHLACEPAPWSLPPDADPCPAPRGAGDPGALPEGGRWRAAGGSCRRLGPAGEEELAVALGGQAASAEEPDCLAVLEGALLLLPGPDERTACALVSPEGGPPSPLWAGWDLREAAQGRRVSSWGRAPRGSARLLPLDGRLVLAGPDEVSVWGPS